MRKKFITHLTTNFNTGKAFFIALLLSVASVLLFFHFYKPASINIEFQADSDSTFQIYWADKNKAYSEKRSSLTHFNTRKKQCKFSLPNLKNIVKLRIDPVKKPSKLVIKKITIKQSGYQTIRFETREELKKITPLYEIQEYVLNQKGLTIISSGNDPQLEIAVKPILESRILSYSTYIIGIFITLLFALMTAPYIPLYFERIFPSKKARTGGAAIAVIGSAFLIIVIPVKLPLSFTLLFFILYLIAISIPVFLLSYWFLSRPVYKHGIIKVSSVSWLWYVSPCYLIWTIYLLAFWPGSMSPDSLSQWEDAMTGHFRDWHPAFYSMNIWLITRLWCSPSAVAFTQILMLGLTAGWGLVIMQRLGVSKNLLLIVCLFFALSPVNGLMVITIWKDVAYSIAVLAMTLVVLQIVISDGEWIISRNSWIFFGVIIALTAIYRHNGISTALGTPLILIVIYRKFWKQFTFALLLGIIIYIGIRGPLYEILDINRGLPKVSFNPKISKFDKSRPNLISQNPLTETGEKKPIIRSTINALNYYVALSSTIWRIKPLKGRFRRAEYVNLWWNHKKEIRYINPNKFYKKFGIRENSLSPRIRNFIFNKFIWSISTPPSYFIWRPAFYLYLFLASVVIASIRVKSWKFLLLSVPIILHVLPFFLISTSKAIFRYHYSVAIVSLLLSLPLFFLKKNVGDDSAL